MTTRYFRTSIVRYSTALTTGVWLIVFIVGMVFLPILVFLLPPLMFLTMPSLHSISVCFGISIAIALLIFGNECIESQGSTVKSKVGNFLLCAYFLHIFVWFIGGSIVASHTSHHTWLAIFKAILLGCFIGINLYMYMKKKKATTIHHDRHC